MSFRVTLAFLNTGCISENSLAVLPERRRCIRPYRTVCHRQLLLWSASASVLSRFPSEPVDSHLSERLCLLRTELLFLSTTRVPSRRHVMHQRPQVLSVGFVPNNRSTRLFASYLGDVLLMVPVNMMTEPPTILSLTSRCRSLIV